MRISSIFILACLFLTAVSAKADSQESVYDRVMKTGQIRCGYALWPDSIGKDPNTGKLSGSFYEYMQALGDAMELKIVWTEEISFGDLVEALRSNRVDAMCSGIWTNAIRGKFVDFTTPIAYNAVNAFVREGDTRFDNNLSAINSPEVMISVTDGESAATIAKTDFPNAKTLSMPKGTEGVQMLLNVVHKKADVAFTDLALAHAYISKNPGKLREVPAKFPLRVFGVTIAIKKGETALKESLDTATKQLLWTGVIDRILDKYEKQPGMFLRVPIPFVPATRR